MVETEQTGSVAAEIQTAVRHSAVYGLGAVLAKVLGFLLLPVYTRYLGPNDYGVLELLDVSMSLLGMFLNMGMTAALLRYYAFAKTPEAKRRVFSTAFIFVGVTGGFLFVVALGSVTSASALLLGPSVPSHYLLLSISSFLMGYIATPSRVYYRAREASGTLVTLDTIGLFLSLVLNIVFIVVLRTGLVGILLSHFIVNLGWMVVSAWVVRRVGCRFEGVLLRKMMRFGLPLVLSNLSMFALNYSDRFFLRSLDSVDAVGVYAVGYRIAFLMNFLLVQPFYIMWQARMYAVYSRPDHPSVYAQIFGLYSTVLVYATLALSLLSPEIVTLMVGPGFASCREMIPPIALAYCFAGIGNCVQAGALLAKRTAAIGGVSAAAAVLNLGLNYILIRQYGMVGAAWATLLSFLIITAGTYWLSQRTLPLPFGIGRFGGTLLLGACLYAISRALQPETVWAGLALKGVLLCMFPALVWKANLLSPAEAGTVASLAARLVSGVSQRVGWLPVRRAPL